MKSLHLIASAKMGGAERWFVRFLQAMQAAGEEAHAVVRPSVIKLTGMLASRTISSEAAA